MTIGKLDRRIEVLQQTEVRDEFGAIVGNWVTVGRVWANIKPGIGSEHLFNQQIEGDESVVFTVRFYAGLEKTHRIRYMGKTYEIVGIKDENTGHRWMVITAKEIENGNIFGEAEKVESQD